MTEVISSIFGSFTADNIVSYVVYGLLALWVLGLLGRIPRQAVPSLMTSLGILGTFSGIFVALAPLDFGAEQINQSIQLLLDGMETAFVTSLLGLASAIAFKVFVSVRFTRKEVLSPEYQKLEHYLKDIKQAISGEGDSSLVTQMQKLRNENRDGFAKLDGLSDAIRGALVENLENLIKEIRDIIGKQLGDSLQALIADIEKALIEQFGETFVQFNNATQALNEWQKDHRRQVEQLTVAFDKTAKGIETISAECADIPKTMDNLRKILEAANSQVEGLTERLEAFAAIRQQAMEAFPVIKKNLDQIGEDLRSSSEGFSGLEEMIRNSQKEAERSIKETAEIHTKNVEEVTHRMRSAMESAQQEAARQINGMIEAAIEKHTNQVSEQLERIATEWGNNLVSIAERCAETIEKSGK